MAWLACLRCPVGPARLAQPGWPSPVSLLALPGWPSPVGKSGTGWPRVWLTCPRCPVGGGPVNRYPSHTHQDVASIASAAATAVGRPSDIHWTAVPYPAPKGGARDRGGWPPLALALGGGRGGSPPGLVLEKKLCPD